MKLECGATFVILAGGHGARFWPVSRSAHPKQFLSISPSGESLIKMTAERIKPLTLDGRVLIVTSHLHEELVHQHVDYADLICEPCPRNTAAAIALAATYLSKKDPDGVMVCLPADHAVTNPENLRLTLTEAVRAAASGDHLVTIGIQPTRPDTAYGYIQRGEALEDSSFRVHRFFEKPSLERAQQYLESGDFYWNSGMFAWKVSTILSSIQEYMPDLSQACQEISKAIGTTREHDVVAEQFERLESISIDFGVMEHAKNCLMVAAHPYGWNDVGSWDSWAEHFPTDKNSNVLNGDVLSVECERSLLYSSGRLVAALGVKDLVVIDSGDAVMVCPRDRVQEVRKLVDKLKAQKRDELL